MKAFIVADMKHQFAKKYNKENWDEVLKEIEEYDTFSIGGCDICLGQFEEVFSGEPIGGSKFDIGEGLVLVPYYRSGRNDDSQPLAIYNLHEIAKVDRSLECAVLYRKLDPSQPAYLLYDGGEGQISMHKF